MTVRAIRLLFRPFDPSDEDRGGKERGATLIELLIAAVISSILIAGLYRTFINQQRNYSIQEQVVDMKQNARAAVSRMMAEIRMAGFGNVPMVLPVTFDSKTFGALVNPDAPEAGAITIVSAIDRTTTLQGKPGDTIGGSTLGKNQIAVSSLSDFDLDKKKYVSIGGIESHAIVQMDSVKKIVTLNGNVVQNHAMGTLVFPIRAISYQIVIEGGVPILKRDENTGGGRQPMAENIESLQFQYFDADGNLTAIPSSIRMVRTTVVAKTSSPDPQLPVLRRQVASNIYLRNVTPSY